MIICAGRTEQFYFAEPIGVGLVESAYNLSRMLYIKKPSKLLFVGSCGSYGNKKVLDSFFSSSGAQIEHSWLFKNTYTPIENKILNNVSHETIVNSSNYITSSKGISERFLDIGLEVENMEFYSVLWCAKKAGIEVGGFFVVTNYCYEDARLEYKNSLKEATEIIHDRYEKELKVYE